MKIGIMGGTFDPIHNGHLIVAEYARTFLNLDKIIFIPSGNHPFKDNNEISRSDNRIDMILLAIDGNQYFEMSLMEVNRIGTTYTIDTITSLKEEYKEDELYFIVGSDILFEIEKWKNFDELINLCKFILLDRSGKEEQEISKKVIEIESSYKIQIKKVKAPIVDISSTEIRERVNRGLSIKYLVPEVVEKYILNNSLYKKVNIHG